MTVMGNRTVRRIVIAVMPKGRRPKWCGHEAILTAFFKTR
jgi:hypothetical protein